MRPALPSSFPLPAAAYHGIGHASSSSAAAAASMGVGGGHPGDSPDKELHNWSSIIGIVAAIVGNVLIALALNVQRYAHLRLHRQRRYNRARAEAALKRAQGHRHRQSASSSSGRLTRGAGYGTVWGGGNANGSGEDVLQGNGHDAQESDPLTSSFEPDAPIGSDLPGDELDDNTNYLRSPYWWAGQVLITLGEIGNFLAYGFAPASIVSPLGVVALVANCVIAPFLFRERFRQRDGWGVVIAVAGVVTVVLSAKQQETKLEPHDVWDAITTIEFEIYLAVTISLIMLLMWASTKYGNRTILIDLGLVGLFGGYTALATKGVSSMLSATLWRAFATPVTYALLLVLLVTAVMQIRYVNRALSRFDSTQVIPIQFVLFTLCVIIGSAVLYRDFERTTAEQGIKFIGGCLLTFFGVFLITSGRHRKDDEETLLGEEGIEETIGLHVQGSSPQPHTGTHRGSTSSRRSSRASRVSFADGVTKPLSVQRDTGVPSQRNPPAAALSKSSPASVPLLVNPWPETPEEQADEPGLPNISTESLSSVAVTTPVSEATPDTPTNTTFIPTISAPDLPATPRAPTSARPTSRHYPDLMISPSPLSSTVSAVVNDTLRRHVDSPLLHKSSLGRIKSSIRASLFIPDDDDDDDEDTDGDDQQGREIPAGAEDLATLSDGAADDLPPAIHESEAPASDSPRRRARSLSSTLGDLFKRKRRKGAITESEASEGAEDRRAGGQE